MHYVLLAVQYQLISLEVYIMNQTRKHRLSNNDKNLVIIFDFRLLLLGVSQTLYTQPPSAPSPYIMNKTDIYEYNTH